MRPPPLIPHSRQAIVSTNSTFRLTFSLTFTCEEEHALSFPDLFNYHMPSGFIHLAEMEKMMLFHG